MITVKLIHPSGEVAITAEVGTMGQANAKISKWKSTYGKKFLECTTEIYQSVKFKKEKSQFKKGSIVKKHRFMLKNVSKVSIVRWGKV